MTSGTVRVNKEQQAAMAFFASAPADPDPAGDSWGPTADACLWIPGGLGSMGVLAYFALLFTRAMGVDTPHAHAVPRDSAAITAFLRRVEHGEVAFANPVDEDRMTGFFAREYFIVLGYAAGDTIVGMVGSIAQQLVLKARSDDGEAKTKGDAISASVDVDAIHAAVRARFCVPALEQLGAIAAVDLAINNFDRFPLGVWDNAGNPGNVIVDASVPPKVVAIDHALLPVDVEAHPAAWDRYISRVRTRTREVDEWWAKHGDGHGDGDPAAAELPELLASVRTVISDCTGHDIGVAGSVAVARGFRETRRRFAHKASVKKISEIEKKAHPLTECSRNAVDLPVAIRFVKAVMKEIQLDG